MLTAFVQGTIQDGLASNLEGHGKAKPVSKAGISCWGSDRKQQYPNSAALDPEVWRQEPRPSFSIKPDLSGALRTSARALDPRERWADLSCEERRDASSGYLVVLGRKL